MKTTFHAGADVRKVKAALNRTIAICRRARLFDMARETVRAKLSMRRASV